MPAEARTSSVWRKQKLFVSLFFLAFAGYFFLDGFYTWPFENRRFEAHAVHQKEGRLAEWPAYAKSQNWNAKPPEKLHSRDDILGQFLFGGLMTLIGGILLVYWATQKGRVLRSDEEAVYTPAGTRVPFEAITGIGLKNWDSKGLAKVRYKLNERQGEFVVDDYKFEAGPTRQIMAEIEEHLKTREVVVKEVTQVSDWRA